MALYVCDTDKIQGSLPFDRIRKCFGENVSGHSVSFAVDKFDFIEASEHLA
jgi:hypothetical protein